MRSIGYTPRAQADLDDIWNFIARDDVRAANKVLATIAERIANAAANPGLGHLHREIKDPTVRCLTVYSYLVLYDWDDRALNVLRIVHGRRNLSGLTI